MSREIQYDSSQRPVANNLYAAIFNAQLQVWNGSTFVELSTAPLAAACLVQLGELGAGPLYAADMPEGIVTLDPGLAGVYYCQFFDQSSASIASPAVLTALTAVGEQILASDVTSALAACGLAPVATLTVTSNTGSATTFNVTGIAPFWTGPIIGLTGANIGQAGNITANVPGSGSSRVLTVSGLANAPGVGDTFAAVNWATAKALAAVATAVATPPNASTFTGVFPASVLAKAPTGGSVISQTPPIVPGEMKVFQYGAFVQPGAGIPQQIGVTDCKGNPISLAGRTIEILATSPANRQHVLWKWTTADALTIVGANSNVIQIDADNTNSQTAGDFLLFAWDVTGGTRTAIPEASVRLVVLPAPQPQ
jgi:hypothetical protein